LILISNHFLIDFDFDLMFLGRKSLYSTFHLYTVNKCTRQQPIYVNAGLWWL